MPTRGLSHVTWPSSATVSIAGVPIPAAPWPPWRVVANPIESAAGLSWNYPYNDGNSPVTDYLILPYIGANPQPIIDTGGPQTSFLVSGLTDGTVIAFAVMAVNAIGSSAWSALSSWVTIGPVAETWDVSATFGGASYGSGCELI